MNTLEEWLAHCEWLHPVQIDLGLDRVRAVAQRMALRLDCPVIEAIVDIGALEDFPSNTLPGFYDRLAAWLPGLIEHRCSVGRRGGFLMRLRDGTWPGHILEHVALELQTQAGMKTGFGKARMTHERGVYKVVIRTRDEAIGKRALESARDLVMAAINDRRFCGEC